MYSLFFTNPFEFISTIYTLYGASELHSLTLKYKETIMATTSTVQHAVKGIETISDDSHLQDELSRVCHCCGEKKRFMEDTNAASELRSMSFSGAFSESVQDYMDIMSITH